jgi:MFS family permease
VSLAQQGAGGGGVSSRVAGLLTLAAFINYVDRGNLATAGPLIQDQLKLSHTELGVLLAAFFWSYAPAQLPAGWLAERLDPRRVLAAGLAIWGAATALTGLTTGFITLLLLRVMLGVGESVMYPASFKILAVQASDRQRGRANGFLASGQLLGPAVGTLLGGLLMARYGWRAVFVAFGCASLLWLWPWLTTPPPAVPQRSPQSTVAASEGPSMAAILRRRELWGSCLGQFCGTYTLYLVLSWLPVYLVKTHGLSMAQMAPMGAGVYALSAGTSVLTGWAGDRWLKAGAAPSRIHMSGLIAGLAVVTACLMACAHANSIGALLAMAGCGVGIGIWTPALFVSAQTLAGPHAVGRWFGIQNCIGNLAGVSASLVTGMVVDRTGHFGSAFVIAAVFAVIGMVAFGFIVRRIEPIDWRTAEAERLVPALPPQG